MNKRFVMILSVLLAIVLLAACGTTAAAPAGTVEEPEETPVSATAETSPEESAEAELPEEAAETAEPVTIRLGGLKGPTSIGLVKLLEDAKNGETANEYEFTMAAAADELTPKLLKGELDILAVPANLASILYNRSEGGVKMIAVNTLGVIYIVEKGGESISSLEDLRGRTIYATGKGTTPEYALTYLLSQSGLDIEKDVTMEWKSEPTEVVATISTMDKAVAMLPQPFVTVAGTKVDGLRTALDLTQEWEDLDNGSTFITAGLVVRSDFAEENPEALRIFLEEYKASTDFVNANTAEAAVLVEQYDIVNAKIAEKAIPYCNIVCIPGEEMQTILSGYLQVLYEQNPASVGGALPQEDFYWPG
ncbi:MAG: ABC transporter substrate-binding protein [Oscillospiraceae bacterium]|nr:ABC transporter substrate-binding protein [Oscillospiraceae bacterium]